MTTTAPPITDGTTADLAEQVDELFSGDGRFHGAHPDCQTGERYVRLVCGRLARWEDQHALGDSSKPDCPDCFGRLFIVCPVCGSVLVNPLRGASR